MSPSDFLTKSAKILMKVDLPAPLGPNKPNIDPVAILREILSRARTSLFEPAL